MRSQPRAAYDPSGLKDDHHEGPAIDTARTLFSAGVVIATVILSCVASRAIYSALFLRPSDRSPTPLYGEGLTLPAEPRLEGIQMMSALSADKSPANDDQLQNYGWIDRNRKIVHIPIQRAMDLAIERGWLQSAAPKQDQTLKQIDSPTISSESRSAR